MTDKAATPRTGALMAIVAMTRDEMKERILQLERELAACQERYSSALEDGLRKSKAYNELAEKLQLAEARAETANAREGGCMSELKPDPATVGAMVLEIDSAYSDALEYSCTCGQDELSCKHCGKWTAARQLLKRALSNAAATKDVEIAGRSPHGEVTGSTPVRPAPAAAPDMVPVPIKALREIVVALNGPSHYIRELQAIKRIEGDDGSITILENCLAAAKGGSMSEPH